MQEQLHQLNYMKPQSQHSPACQRLEALPRTCILAMRGSALRRFQILGISTEHGEPKAQDRGLRQVGRGVGRQDGGGCSRWQACCPNGTLSSGGVPAWAAVKMLHCWARAAQSNVPCRFCFPQHDPWALCWDCFALNPACEQLSLSLCCLSCVPFFLFCFLPVTSPSSLSDSFSLKIQEANNTKK